ncbi:coil containing protein [Vibrio phage 1.215.B._10N.222.54.F7]|nr:coil containing protein [Vibrio phage 1.215.A._10N.222.54.F7]AUR96067.1 coil containing protein [Vibrio phage 1.215.B._10N.222.54.F7]
MYNVKEPTKEVGEAAVELSETVETLRSIQFKCPLVVKALKHATKSLESLNAEIERELEGGVTVLTAQHYDTRRAAELIVGVLTDQLDSMQVIQAGNKAQGVTGYTNRLDSRLIERLISLRHDAKTFLESVYAYRKPSVIGKEYEALRGRLYNYLALIDTLRVTADQGAYVPREYEARYGHRVNLLKLYLKELDSYFSKAPE